MVIKMYFLNWKKLVFLMVNWMALTFVELAKKLYLGQSIRNFRQILINFLLKFRNFIFLLYIEQFLKHLLICWLFFKIIISEHIRNIVNMMLPFLDFIRTFIRSLKPLHLARFCEILCRFHLIWVWNSHSFWKIAHFCIPLLNYGHAWLPWPYHNLWG